MTIRKPAEVLWPPLAFLLLVLACHSSGKMVEPRREDSARALSFYSTARNHIEAGEFPAALANLDSAIYYNPSFARLYQVKGWVWEHLNHPDSAAAAYENCLQHKSYYPEVWLRLGRLYLHADKPALANPYLRRASQVYPDSAQIYLELGEGYTLAGKNPLALDSFRAYLQMVDQPRPEFWKWRGITYFQSNDDLRAIDDLEKYVSAAPADSRALKTLGIAYFRNGQLDKAISRLNQAGGNRKDDPEIFLYRSRYFFALGKPDAGWEQLNVAMGIDSADTGVIFEAALRHYDEERYSKAGELFEKVVRLKNDYWRAYRYLGFLAQRENNFVRAREFYTLYLQHTYEEDPEVSRRLEEVSGKKPSGR